MVKRILFTAPDTYHTSLHKAFDERPACSFRPMFVPFISSTLLPPGATFLPFCNELETFDYIICSSIMAVRALASAGVDTSLIDGKVIAIGNDQNTVRQLLGITPALPDAKPSMMGILDALKGDHKLLEKRIAVLWPKFCGLPVQEHTVTAVLTEAVTANHGREEYIGVRLINDPDGCKARPLRTKSGLISVLAGSDGFICVPRDCEGFPAGAEITVHLYDQ